MKKGMKIYMEDNLCTILKLVFNKIQKFLLLNGQIIVDNPEKAELMIIGTCAAFDADEERSIEIASRIQSFSKPIYVYGCMVSVSPNKLKKLKLKNLFSSWNAQQLAESIIMKPKISWDSIDLPTEFRIKNDYRIYNSKKHFVGISTGCAFNCSYCPHKIGAGNIVSRPVNEILNQIKFLINREPQTIVLTGTDVACYGQDINTSFSLLLEKILKILPDKTSLHIAQFNPQGLYFDFDTLIKCCQDNRITDFQLPIQTASERLLKLMNRKYFINDIQKFITEVKKKNTNIMFRTDLMVGFPTEVEEDLVKSIEFVVKYFGEAAVYGFELKNKTPIASYNLPFFNEGLIKKKVDYALKKIKQSGLLVHSGGQDISSLNFNDQIKEKIIKNNKKI
jgi:tRNA A37 methylthiotransferase MiaB